MVRAPCCQKMGLKKGPWTSEEDQILVNYIHLYGHGNWRALPKQAGLLRCGKSCRLRWINYLRPDIKRGNFSREEEETIIKLHELLGNRWSAIAARLPGRTDNEIKNVWHTHLKKRLQQNHTTPETTKRTSKKLNDEVIKMEPEPMNFPTSHAAISDSPECSSDVSSVTIGDNNDNSNMFAKVESPGNFLEMDEKFWSEVLSTEEEDPTSIMRASSIMSTENLDMTSSDDFSAVTRGPIHDDSSNMHDGMDFWFNLLTRAGELPELTEIDPRCWL